MTFHMPDSYYEPPDEQECNCLNDPCTCEEDAQDAYDDAMIERGERAREDREMDGPEPGWEP
jgi:hypothetical protein